MEVVEPAHAFDAATRPGRGWLPEVDFLCVLFPAEAGWETPVSVLLEIGQAVGAGMPVLLVAEPPRRLDPALFSLSVARVPLNGKVALSVQLGRFLQSMHHPGSVAMAAPVQVVDAAELDAISLELRSLRQTEGTGGGAAQVVARRLEETALRLLRAAGAEAEEARRDDGGDIAAWVPGTERFIPGPILVEVKLVRDQYIDRNSLNQLQLYALTRDAPWSLLLYYSWDPNRVVRLPPGEDWPTVMVFNIEDLVSELRRQPLAQILNNERNQLVHRPAPR